MVGCLAWYPHMPGRLAGGQLASRDYIGLLESEPKTAGSARVWRLPGPGQAQAEGSSGAVGWGEDPKQFGTD